MATKLRLTRPELKRQREALARFSRYLPMLKLKQQQLQVTVQQVRQQLRQARQAHEAAEQTFEPYRVILADRAGVNVPKLAEPMKVRTSTTNVAGVNVPVFDGVEFEKPAYSLFATPPWVDRVLADLREISRLRARAEALSTQHALLQKELTKIVQRVNLFEKVKIPEAEETIRIIRIKLGDEMTAAVGRGKIAKKKLLQSETPATREQASGEAFVGDPSNGEGRP